MSERALERILAEESEEVVAEAMKEYMKGEKR